MSTDTPSAPTMAADDRALGNARQHLTAALTHSVDGRPDRAQRHCLNAADLLYGRVDAATWRRLAAARVLHIRGERREARYRMREVAQQVDAELEVGGDE